MQRRGTNTAILEMREQRKRVACVELGIKMKRDAHYLPAYYYRIDVANDFFTHVRPTAWRNNPYYHVNLAVYKPLDFGFGQRCRGR